MQRETPDTACLLEISLTPPFSFKPQRTPLNAVMGLTALCLEVRDPLLVSLLPDRSAREPSLLFRKHSS